MSKWKEKTLFEGKQGLEENKHKKNNVLDTSIYIKQSWNCKPDLENLFYIEVDKNKSPYQSDWNEPNNQYIVKYNNLSKGNYGILTGHNDLLVIDIDSEIIYADILSVCPDTLRVKTGSPEYYKKHLYYYKDNPKTLKVKDKNTDTLVDVLGCRDGGNYCCVVAPGSIHPSGNTYKIENDRPIHRLNDDEWIRIKEVLDRYNYIPEIKPTKKKDKSDNNIFDEIKSEIDLESYLLENGMKFTNKKSPCIYHYDKQNSLHLYDDHCYCFGCSKKYTIIDFIMYYEGLEINQVPEWYKERRDKEENKKKREDNNVMDNETQEDIIEPIYEFPYDVMSGVAKEFVELYCRNSELAETHIYFSFLTMLGSILAPNIFMDDMTFTTTKLYTILLGESDSKKSFAIKQTEKFFEDIEKDLNICSGVGSGEGLLQKIKSVGEDEEKKQVLLVYDELKNFIDKASIESSSLASIVCTLFEKSKSENITKKEKQVVKNVFLSLLGACTFETYEMCWKGSFTSQGLSNRFMVVPGKSDKLIARPKRVDVDKKQVLQDKVRAIIDNIRSSINYTMKVDNNADKLFNEFYLRLKKKEKSDISKRIEGYILKLATLISLSDGKYQIDLDSMEKSIKLGEWQLKMRKLTKPLETDTLPAEIESKILKALENTNVPMTDRDIDSKTKVRSRKGIHYYTQARDGLIRSGDIIKVRKGNGKEKMWLSHRELPSDFEEV